MAGTIPRVRVSTSATAALVAGPLIGTSLVVLRPLLALGSTTVVLGVLSLRVPAAEELAFGLVCASVVEGKASTVDLEDLEGILVGCDSVFDAEGMQRPVDQGVSIDCDCPLGLWTENVVDDAQGAQYSQQSA